MSRSRKSSRVEAESKSESRLAQLTLELLAGAHQPPGREKAEFAVWNSERKKWTRYGAGSPSKASPGKGSR